MSRLFAAVAVLLAVSSPALCEGKRFAVCVGVNQYDHPKIDALKFAVPDAVALAELLGGKAHGYEVKLIADGARATQRSNLGH